MLRTALPILFFAFVCGAPVASSAQSAPGETFRDCPDCPEMVVVPAGNFQMGSNSGDGDEKPVHHVSIPQAFAVGKLEVTFSEWDACNQGGGCSHRPVDKGWGRGNRPVIYVSWDDAKEYARWLTRKTGEDYRLLSESEWEYAARSGSSTKYSWGDDIGRGNANCAGCGSRWDDSQTAPVGSFRANGFGLHDMQGNVWEWVEDCWNDSYSGAPNDGRVWTSGDCSRRVLRGGSWNYFPRHLRAAYRSRNVAIYRNYGHVGFRVARTVSP